MKKWEEFEEYLYECDVTGTMSFNVHAVAEDLGITVHEATSYIQSYVGAQGRVNTQTLYVLHRASGTRTSNTMWKIGERAPDARDMGAQLVSDLATRVERFHAPALERLGQKNPRAVPAAEAILKGIEAGIELMAALMTGDEDDA